jgi:hypothetical protein
MSVNTADVLFRYRLVNKVMFGSSRRGSSHRGSSHGGSSHRGSSPTVKEGSHELRSPLRGALLNSRATAPMATASAATAPMTTAPMVLPHGYCPGG